MSVARDLAGIKVWWPQQAIQRILVVGPSGSGKSTLGHQLAQQLGLPAFELDDLNWLPNWQMRPASELRESVQAIVDTEAWILIGNYERTQDLSWSQADLVIWLDLGKIRVLWRVFWRCLRRAGLRQTCCNGNYESLGMTFASKESLLLWIWQTHAQIHQRYHLRSKAKSGPLILALRHAQDLRRLWQFLTKHQKQAAFALQSSRPTSRVRD